MRKPEERLLARLDAIGASLERAGHALALLGLGSVGLELERLDAYSDLDFFALVEPGYKQRFMNNLDWLSELCPVAYAFRNSNDGYKLLYEDGIFCEFAIFEPDELRRIPFSPGRVVWKQPQIADDIGHPVVPLPPAPERPDSAWLVGEALTNLLVGLGRFWRGEKLSAARFIQGYAVDRILDLAVLVEPEKGAFRDRFASERRFEQRFPVVAANLPDFVQGFERSPESALAILAFLEQHFEVNQPVAQAVRNLAVFKK